LKELLRPRFYGIKNCAHEKQNFSFFIKKTKRNRPVEEGYRRIGRSLPENLLYGIPLESEVFLQLSTADFNIAFSLNKEEPGSIRFPA
jgi:hypothetical protein